MIGDNPKVQGPVPRPRPNVSKSEVATRCRMVHKETNLALVYATEPSALHLACRQDFRGTRLAFWGPRFGRDASVDGPKYGPKLPWPAARAVWGHCFGPPALALRQNRPKPKPKNRPPGPTKKSGRQAIGVLHATSVARKVKHRKRPSLLGT